MAGSAGDSDDAIVTINVTPLVDVTLVLCIILMVTAKMVTNPSAIPLELPKASQGTDVQSVFSIELAANGATVVDGKIIANDDAIYPLAQAAQKSNNELRCVIKADSAVQHGRVIHVLDLLKQAHVAKIAFGVSPTAPIGSGPPK
ncbi:biopolymer transporter ExbD [soil metagenome]